MARVAIVLMVTASTIAAAEPLLQPPSAHRMTDRDRALHGALIVGMGATYLAIELGFKSDLASAACRWCDPPAYDVAIRDALRWNDTARASAISTGTGYIGAPIAAVGLLMAATWEQHDWRRWFDDVSPVLESAIAVSLLQHAAKFSVAQQRPFVHYAPPGSRTPTDDDNDSFWSGHTSLAFSLAVSAGVVADERGYAIAPAIWVTGLTLASATGYLRVAADAHYATDVIVGAAMGSLVGYAWPHLVHRDLFAHDVVLSPTPNGLALAGRF